MKKDLKIAIIGGCGYWSERNHHKHILELKQRLPVKLGAIVDPIDPRSVKTNKNMQKLWTVDKPVWLNPRDFQNTNELIKNLQQRHKIDVVIIASNPCTHFEYGIACMKYGINVICDKPIVSNYNAATCVMAASTIRKKFDLLLKAYSLAKKRQPNLLFHSILRRRSLESFNKTARELHEVYKKTGAGINNMTILINGGVYKLPAELNNQGAHGYLDGIGSLSHSAYHYIDVLSWFLSAAPGKAVKIVPSLNYVTRIKDYLDSEAYMQIARIIKADSKSLTLPVLPEAVLGCELNSGFTFTMKDMNDIPVGTISFLYNHTSFAPRVNTYDESNREPMDHKGGGRISHCFIDIHQEGLQNWQIIKNDVASEKNTIRWLQN
ncbi:MAG: hypothetical protein UW92_C0015G0007 [Candidatus Jorgensenbacteria bacterium GW2011_GWA2_45_13]|uniref:Gfo/Idh/MocA-like oxidoreductase N-terminal domain-containing protein n=1 Tax=Candidatus Jorgensenbacteria bacterium GW2011_GWA2_45_13 TaxID=1618662 RepID=A0A0G1NDR2_9BACT|nr:MAG: hypothetical protein UW92_C0015G0007 [Candidatus Jorgensenbacteria bacterium GW2011_GWA2_45_13]